MEGGGVSAKPVWAPNHAFYKRYILRLQLCYEVMISMSVFSMIETVCIGNTGVFFLFSNRVTV